MNNSHFHVANMEATACEPSNKCVYVSPSFNKTMAAVTNTRVTREIFTEGYEVRGRGKSS